MKAIISASNYSRGNFPELEQHWFDLHSEDGKINAKLEITNQMWNLNESPLIKPHEIYWEYDIEIIITAKPKQEGLIIKI